MSRTVAVDLAKSVFQVAVANHSGRIVERQRLSRSECAALFRALPPTHVVMEACGSAHHWGRLAQQLGHRVSLLPPRYVRASLPAALRQALAALYDEVRQIEARVAQHERDLAALAAPDPVVRRLQSIPGVGLLTATAARGSVANIHSFRRSRQSPAGWV